MRRFLLTALFLVLFISLAGALTGIVLQYSALEEQSRTVADLQNSLRGFTASQLTSEVEIGALEEDNRLLRIGLETREAEVTTLEAAVAHPPVPTATPPTRPVVWIIAPADHAQVEEREMVVIQWQATNQDRIGRVAFQVDGNPAGETALDGPTSAEGEFTWFASGLGNHVLSVIAANTLGAEGRPATVTMEVVVASEPRRHLREEDSDVMDGIETVVTSLRGLMSLEPVTRTVYSRDELVDYVIQVLDQDYSPEDAHRDALELAALGFLPADTDLRGLIQALYTEQIAGFYDSDTGSLAVISDEAELSPLDKTTYAHEFTHALQDQHYGLEALDPEDNSDDASLAVTALIEGDAMLVQEQYMLQFLDSEDLFEMLTEAAAAEYPLLDSAPPIVREQLMFPYDAGLLFVKTIIEDGGYEALNEAYLHPPLSTEQVLHPDKYLSGELPQVVGLPALTATLGSGWQWVDTNVLGEFTLRLYLEQHLTSRQAAAAAAGWGGDRYVVYHDQSEDALVLVMRTVWDTATEAAEFMDAYRVFGEARFGTTGGETAARVCWASDNALCIYQAGAETLIIYAPTAELVGEVEAAFSDY